MTKNVDFLPIANVEVADDGKVTMTIDWSSSLQGELDESGCGHQQTPLAEHVSTVLNTYLGNNPSLLSRSTVTIGQVNL